MATRTINPQSNPYGGGAIIFDSTPYVEYYLKEQQKEDAKNEAIDKYYQEEMSKISPAGMRSEDLPVFTDRYNQLKKLWIENKEAIKNPAKYGFEKAQQYNQLKADLMSMPIESKEEKEKEATVLKLLADPSKRELIDMPTLSEAIRIQKMPIRSEGRQPIDLANLPFVAKEMTPQEKMAYQKSILSLAGKDKTVGQPIKIGKFEEKVTETEKFSDDNLRKLGEIARKDALTNKNLQRTAKLDFERITPEMKLELNALHNQIYGRPIQGAEDLAAASIIQAGRLAKKEEEKTQRDIDALEKKKDQRTATMAAAKNAEGQTLMYYNSYGEIKDKAKNSKTGALPINELSATTQENILNIAKKSLGDNDISNDLLAVYVNPNTGEITLNEVQKVTRNGKVVDAIGGQIAKLTELDLNYSNAPSVKEKRQIAQKSSSGKEQTQEGKPKSLVERMKEAAAKKK